MNVCVTSIWVAFGVGMFVGVVITMTILGLLSIAYEKYNNRKKNIGD